MIKELKQKAYFTSAFPIAVIPHHIVSERNWMNMDVVLVVMGICIPGQ